MPSAINGTVDPHCQVRTTLNYAVRPQGELYYYLQGAERPPGIPHFTNLEREQHPALVQDLRAQPQQFTLAQNGFKLAKLPVPEQVDWDDKASVQAKYYPLAQKLLQAQTGATRILVFDHTRRCGSISLKSGVDRLQQLLHEEAPELQKTPFAILQMWQPIRGPLQDSPLAIMDYTSLDPKDLIPVNLYFPDRHGQIAAVAHNSNQRWFYAQGMRTDECYIWIGYHSCKGFPRTTPHTSFEDPSTPPDAPDRESIEIRAFAFWQDDAPHPPDMDF